MILSAGALDSPKLLLLSGIGPKAELSKLHIPIINDLPGVGENLCDRLFLELVSIRQEGSHHRTSYITTPDGLEEARKQWIKDKSGPLAGYYLPQMIGYFKSDKIIHSKEFQELDGELQRALIAETKPTYEIVSVCYFHMPDFDCLVPVPYTLNLRIFLLMMNHLYIAQSKSHRPSSRQIHWHGHSIRRELCGQGIRYPQIC